MNKALLSINVTYAVQLVEITRIGFSVEAACMSNDSDDQTFHSPGPHSEQPAGHDVPTSVARERSQRSESHGTHNLAPRALTDLALVEGATAWSDRQTRSKGQAVPVCLGPLDKSIFDERFAVPRARDVLWPSRLELRYQIAASKIHGK